MEASTRFLALQTAGSRVRAAPLKAPA